MGVLGKCCCLTALLTKIVCLACTFGPLIFMYLLYALYIKPWGEQQVRDLTRGVNLSSPTVNCSGCVVGVNTQFPTNTTGILHFMDTSGGKASSAAVGTSLFATIAAILAGTAVGGSVAQLGSSGSMGAGAYEMISIVEQAQFVGLLGQLATGGVPTFFQQFTKDLSWVNFNVVKLANSDLAPKRQLLNLLEAQHQQTGVDRYATMVGVLPEELFYYTLLALGVVLGGVLVLYVVAVAVMSYLSKSKANLCGTYFRKVIWAFVLILLLALYILSMTGSYRAYFHIKRDGAGAASAAIVILLVIVGTTLIYGILVIATNPSELADIGTFEHEQRPFNAAYGPYYEEFNVDNRYFFVPKAILAVTSGVIVGVVQAPTWQLGLLIGANLLFLLALVVREPFLLRFLFYIGVLSSFLKVFLLLLMVIMIRDDVFPQNVRDHVAYVIVGVNLAVFALLIVRQLYVAGRKVVLSCGAKKNKDANNTTATRADFDQGESPVQTPMTRQPKTASYTNDLERARHKPTRQNRNYDVREPLNVQATSSGAAGTYPLGDVDRDTNLSGDQSFDSYGSLSFGSYENNMVRQSSKISSDSASVGGEGDASSSIAYLGRKSSYDSFTSLQPGNYVSPSHRPSQSDTPTSFASYNQGLSTFTPNPVRERQNNDTLNDSFQSFQSDDASFTNSNLFQSGGSQVLDTLAAKYLAERNGQQANKGAVAATPLSLSAVPMLERRVLSGDVIARQRSRSLDDWELQPQTKGGGSPSRHSESSLLGPHKRNHDDDDGKRKSVYLRYIANDQPHSFMDSEDEFDL
ncbi:hypothetical protein DYB30_008849 [Aphanomyces astaci]|uniref:TRP C-terminal domain-containing protein n=1 Tax=Aphanomyces astaci TaxID=112090 RepID=A0A397DH50_APHAT|nr:hypothetical protein DYB30_008849 [Aphanomyces astaci]RHZ00125.1 hypothetical protein DYB31_001877 [Aphanomyces astaci]